jgi:Uma2 family endonuclease
MAVVGVNPSKRYIGFMVTGSLVSINEYLSTSYDPDCDYVDGVIEQRNLGKNDHADLQTSIVVCFRNRRKEWGVYAVVEQRVQVSPTRFRVPDVCVVLGERPNEQIFHTPPFICIEILSPEDRLSRVQERMSDYLYFGVSYVWLLDPETRKAYRWTMEGMHEVKELRTENPQIVIPLSDLFEV